MHKDHFGATTQGHEYSTTRDCRIVGLLTSYVLCVGRSNPCATMTEIRRGIDTQGYAITVATSSIELDVETSVERLVIGRPENAGFVFI